MNDITMCVQDVLKNLNSNEQSNYVRGLVMKTNKLLLKTSKLTISSKRDKNKNKEINEFWFSKEFFTSFDELTLIVDTDDLILVMNSAWRLQFNILKLW